MVHTGVPRYTILRSMKCFAEIKERLAAGQSPKTVARWVHEVKKERLDVKTDSLSAELFAFRREMAALELLSIREPEFVATAKARVDAGLNELDELEDIYKIQKARIISMRDLETKLNLPNRMTGNEVRIAAELLRTRHQIKMDLGAAGALPSDRPDLTARTSSKYGARVANVLEDPEKRQRVLEVVQRSIALLRSKESAKEQEESAQSVAAAR